MGMKMIYYYKKNETVNKNIIPLVKAFILFFLLLSNLFPQNADADSIIQEELTIPILTYHKFCIGESPDPYTINISLFEKQIQYLKENDYHIISVSQLISCIDENVFPYKPVVITIDDGFKSTYTLAFPILKKYDFPATIYLYTDFIANGINQLSWQEINEMAKNRIEIGSHSISHCNLINKKNNESQNDYLKRINGEFVISRDILEKNTSTNISSFAYPYGVYSQQIKILAKQAGYKALLNANGMNNSPPIDPYSLNRQIIPAGYSIENFHSLLIEKPLRVNNVFPDDGTITNNQDEKIGAIVTDSNINPTSIYFRLSGSGLLDYTYSSKLGEVSFTPVAPKLLQKRTWVAQIAAVDKNSGHRRKTSWLFTVR